MPSPHTHRHRHEDTNSFDWKLWLLEEEEDETEIDVKWPAAGINFHSKPRSLSLGQRKLNNSCNDTQQTNWKTTPPFYPPFYVFRRQDRNQPMVEWVEKQKVDDDGSNQAVASRPTVTLSGRNLCQSTIFFCVSFLYSLTLFFPTVFEAVSLVISRLLCRPTS